MMKDFEQYQFTYSKYRFQESTPETASHPINGVHFSPLAEQLFIQAIEKVITVSQQLSSKFSPRLPLQGLIDLTTGTLHLAALKPRPGGLEFDAHPLFEHKESGLFETGLYSPRLTSYQKRYSSGPTAHQQLLFFAANKPTVSADDAENKRGFAISIHVTDNNINITIDGKSLSINETAQYLRTKHPANHFLSDTEAENSVLKETGIYSELCEESLFARIVDACQSCIQNYLNEAKLDSYSNTTSPTLSIQSSLSIDSLSGRIPSPEEDSFLSIGSFKR